MEGCCQGSVGLGHPSIIMFAGRLSLHLFQSTLLPLTDRCFGDHFEQDMACCTRNLAEALLFRSNSCLSNVFLKHKLSLKQEIAHN